VVDLAVLGLQLDSMILRVFSSLNDSMTFLVQLHLFQPLLCQRGKKNCARVHASPNNCVDLVGSVAHSQEKVHRANLSLASPQHVA